MTPLFFAGSNGLDNNIRNFLNSQAKNGSGMFGNPAQPPLISKFVPTSKLVAKRQQPRTQPAAPTVGTPVEAAVDQPTSAGADQPTSAGAINLRTSSSESTQQPSTSDSVQDYAVVTLDMGSPRKPVDAQLSSSSGSAWAEPRKSPKKPSKFLSSNKVQPDLLDLPKDEALRRLAESILAVDAQKEKGEPGAKMVVLQDEEPSGTQSSRDDSESSKVREG